MASGFYKEAQQYQMALARLVNSIEENVHKISGDIGYPDILPALEHANRVLQQYKLEIRHDVEHDPTA